VAILKPGGKTNAFTHECRAEWGKIATLCILATVHFNCHVKINFGSSHHFSHTEKEEAHGRRDFDTSDARAATSMPVYQELNILILYVDKMPTYQIMQIIELNICLNQKAK